MSTKDARRVASARGDEYGPVANRWFSYLSDQGKEPREFFASRFNGTEGRVLNFRGWLNGNEWAK